MANYLDSVLLASQHKWNEKFQMPEMRPKPYGALPVYLKNTEALIPGVNQIKNSDTRTNSTYILNRKASNSITAKSHNYTPANGDSSTVNLTWAIRGDTFRTSLKMADRNVFDYDEMVANQLMSAVMNTHDAINTYLVAHLNTNKSQVVKSLTPSNVTWHPTNFIAQVAAANKAEFGLYAKSFMKQQHYTGTIDVIADSKMYALYQYYAAQGGANATNTGYQFMGMNFYESIDSLTFESPTYTGGAYFIPEGTVGLLTWNSPQNRAGVRSGIYEYSTLPDPLGTGILFDVHSYTAGADTSAEGGETQDVVQYFMVTATISAVVADLSTANETPIYKVGQLAS